MTITQNILKNDEVLFSFIWQTLEKSVGASFKEKLPLTPIMENVLYKDLNNIFDIENIFPILTNSKVFNIKSEDSRVEIQVTEYGQWVMESLFSLINREESLIDKELENKIVSLLLAYTCPYELQELDQVVLAILQNFQSKTNSWQAVIKINDFLKDGEVIKTNKKEILNSINKLTELGAIYSSDSTLTHFGQFLTNKAIMTMNDPFLAATPTEA